MGVLIVDQGMVCGAGKGAKSIPNFVVEVFSVFISLTAGQGEGFFV